MDRSLTVNGSEDCCALEVRQLRCLAVDSKHWRQQLYRYPCRAHQQQFFKSMTVILHRTSQWRKRAMLMTFVVPNIAMWIHPWRNKCQRWNEDNRVCDNNSQISARIRFCACKNMLWSFCVDNTTSGVRHLEFKDQPTSMCGRQTSNRFQKSDGILLPGAVQYSHC